jgi:hypothetical protein
MEILEGRTDAPPAFEDEYGFAFRLAPIRWWRRFMAWIWL